MLWFERPSLLEGLGLEDGQKVDMDYIPAINTHLVLPTIEDSEVFTVVYIHTRITNKKQERVDIFLDLL